ncbi:unnamed protein product [Linum trigynum]|uniref:Geranylgeranyl transferase type-1 subunit beta n=1 Tax=Linum trigynum TaxID=586398 RepID=A0AAV2DKN0_9ROSI
MAEQPLDLSATIAEQPLELESSPSASPPGEEENEGEESLGKLVADSSFEKGRHVMFLQMMYQILPHHYQSQEINRLTLAYFAISGLDIVGSLDTVDKDEVASWVLSFRTHPEDIAEINCGEFYGFNGSRSSQYPSDDAGVVSGNHSHLASTYCALAILKIVGYNLSNIDWRPLLMTMRNLQKPDGSFSPIHIGAETDLRFIYCAAAICFMLDDWSGMDRDKATEYILKCKAYDGGFGMTPGAESHGGGTYCAVASLQLMGSIGVDLFSSSASSSILDIPLLLEWCLQRQASDGGFQGRSNKPSDTCYAFWVGAVLKILGAGKLIDEKALRGFLLTCQSEYGGFSKFPDELPDLYHSYYGFIAFGLLEEPGLNSICVELGITDAAALRK